jgi:hypothetical protein
MTENNSSGKGFSFIFIGFNISLLLNIVTFTTLLDMLVLQYQRVDDQNAVSMSTKTVDRQTTSLKV